MALGRVVRFDADRGFGFIAPDDGGDDVFVHANELAGRGIQLSVGSRVRFDMVDGGRGRRAYDVRLLEQEQPGSGAVDSADGTVTETAPNRSPTGTGAPPEEELCEVLLESEFLQQITELLLEAGPELTASQILSLRRHLVVFARKNGWID